MPGVLENAERIFREAKNNFERRNGTGLEYAYVGIHVRHGMDVTMHSVSVESSYNPNSQRNRRHGHVSAPEDYFQHAIEKMRSMFPRRELIFLVSGDDQRFLRSVTSGGT